MHQPTQPPTITATALLHAVPQWALGDGPLYRRLAEAVAGAVDRGDLPRRARLPAERALARRIGLSRGTVVAAYDALATAGLVERRQGSGTWVVDPAAEHAPVPELEAGIRARRLSSRFLGTGGTGTGGTGGTGTGDGLIDLSLSVLRSPAGLPPGAFQADLDDVAELAAGHGYHPCGLPALRERLARIHTANGLPTGPEQIAVTLGAQQAIALTARLLLDPGDRVVVESAAFPGAIDAYSRAGARFETVPLDTGGAQPAAVARAVERAAPRLVYLVPTCHNPTGAVMPDHRRRALAELSDATGTWIVEDETLAWSAFDHERPPPAIAGHARRDRVILIGSLSKLLWGGLRIGWIRADPALIARVGRVKAAEDLGNCAVSQAIALGLLDDIEGLAGLRRAQFRHGAELLAGLLGERLPGWSFRPPGGGLSLWVRLPHGRADELAAVALDHGVAVLPGTAASARELHHDHLRLSCAETDERLVDAVDRLAHAWREYHPAGAALG